MPRRHTPAKHMPYTSTNPCARKRKFKNEQEALKMIEQAELMDMQISLYTYECPYCNGWHLSSSKHTDK